MNIEEYCRSLGIALSKNGHNLSGLCPLHKEKHGSFKVDPAKNLWYCFGCCRGGHLVQLVALVEKVSLEEARRRVGQEAAAAPARMPVVGRPEPLTQEARRRLTQAAEGYRLALERQRSALAYLDRRGIEQYTWVRHRLGWCSPESSCVDPPLGKGARPTLAGRVVVPEYVGGTCVYMQGRALDDAVMPKYLGLRLPKPLYGYYDLQGRLPTLEDAILVEGPFDYLTLRQWGLPAVTGLGASIGPAHVALLYNRSVLLAQHADVAGEIAASHLKARLPRTRRLAPPPGVKDWNDWLQEGATRQDFLDYAAQRA